MEGIVHNEIHPGGSSRQAADITKHVPRQEKIGRDTQIRRPYPHFLPLVEKHRVMTRKHLGGNAELSEKFLAGIRSRKHRNLRTAGTQGMIEQLPAHEMPTRIGGSHQKKVRCSNGQDDEVLKDVK
jgi:hypothetical protein